MEYKVITVPFNGDEREARALQAAFALAKDFSGHVKCIHISHNPKIANFSGSSAGDVTSEDLVAQLDQHNKEHAHIAQSVFRRVEEENNITVEKGDKSRNYASAEFFHMTGNIEKIVAHSAMYSDLVVMERSCIDNHADSYASLIAALFKSARPVLLTSAKAPKLVGYRIAIAWSGSLEGMRALMGALPMLQLAEEVHVITIAKHKADAHSEIEQLRHYLRAHGIECERHLVTQKSGSIGATILKKAKEVKADTLVIGAFTHNRIKERLLGGVTDHMLNKAEVHLLMAH